MKTKFYLYHIYSAIEILKKMIADNVITLESKSLPNSTVYKTKDVDKETYLLPKQYAKKITL